MTLYYQVDNKMGLLLAKTFLIDVSVIPGDHFKFRPLEQNSDIFGRDLRVNFEGMVPGT